ncbi:hypothetical protein [Bifidobacterium vansinderenii]|uniref:Cell surface protein n=1 Tax=Bifidobacterium vansinderenii TaxID=1984871 RepID=A0A229VZW4_9BIFI|nr:hypothetical protein [Bifidobacterium vansinderenii]OXN01164.1 hypothetical protein Tam10B_0562 [Bifidobacterium vansinderenii]
MSLGRTVLKTICALSTVVAVGAGSVAAIAPAFAATGTKANGADAASSSSSTDTTVTDVVLDWGVNPESGGGSYAGGCNALSAGTTGNAGGATIWTADSVDTDGEPLYRTVDESAHAQILKPDANGDLRQVSGFDTRCTNRNGTSISGRTGGLTFTPQGATDAEPTYSENIVRLTGGEGTVNAAAGTAHIAWKDASFTIVYYGGMTYWSIADPVLDIKDGKGTLTGTATGYGADRNDPGKWSTLEVTTIHLADFTTGTGNGDADQIVFGDERIDVQPDYLGVDVGEGQADRTDANAAWWGSFPETWVAFNKLTGQTSYWYTTDGGSDSIQPRKVASPISITWGEAAPAPDTPSNPGDGDGSGGGSGDNSGNGGNGGGDVGGNGSGNGDNTGSGNGPDNGSGGDSNSGNSGNGENGGGDASGNGAGGSGDADGNATVTYSNVTLRWGMNDETNSASYYGDCNFLSAGKAGNTGSARVWTKDLYKAVDGNVSIEKPNSSGQWVRASWDSRCLTRSGDGVTMGKRADGRSINTESQVVIANGSGVMASDGSVTISWKGSWTVAYYGGMTYWSVTDPTLTLDANGNGALTATASGYGSSMTDSGKWVTLSPRTIHVADITGVNLSQAESAHGFTVTPNYLGVAVTASGDHGGQAAKDDGNAAYWGSFPQSFVDFQMETGQSAYWYTAGGARDFAKVTLPMSVQFDASYTVDVPADSPAAATAAGAAASSASGSSSSTSSSGGSGSGASSASASGSTGNKSLASAKKTDDQQKNDASGNDNGGSRAGRSSASDDEPLAEAGTVTLIEDNARTIAAGSAGVAAATAMPLGCGWLIRRRLGLDPSDALDRLLAGR